VTNNTLLRGSSSQDIDVLFKSGPVSPYISADISTLTVPGGARSENACYVVFAGGKDLTGAADECHFVYQQVKGNSSITARVQSAVWEPVGRAALMYRSTLDPGSPMAAMSLLETVGPLRPVFLNRLTVGGRVVSQSGTGSYSPPDAYLKIERIGNELIGSVSADGTFTDTNIVSRVTLDGAPEQMFVGLAVSARDTQARGNGATVTYCGVNLVGGGPPPTGFHRGDTDNNGQLQLTDAVRILGFLFLGGVAPTCKDAADTDGNNQLQLTDAVRILGFLFLGGLPPVAPGPPPQPCGEDNDATHLGCDLYDKC
jgi:hypothetical protein